MAPPAKKQKKVLFNESSDDDSAGDEPDNTVLKVNKDYASRFEHNKKREELARLEEKHGKEGTANDEDDDSEESTSEEEDDNAEFATKDIDGQIMDTLRAIQTKDPRVYDSNVRFYSESNENEDNAQKPKEKPMYLRDYHRQNVLRQMNGDGTEKEGEEQQEGDSQSTAKEPPVKTFQEEQDELKNAVVKEMHAVIENDEDNDNGGEDKDGGDFLVRKKTDQPEEKEDEEEHKPKPLTDEEVANADKNPESFLSNFMSARAWLPTDGSRFQPFESEDEEELEKADRFEEAYNLRFEDPNKMNEQILTHSRDAIKKYSVRREETSGRKKHREAERKRKEEERQEREAERARLRKLKVEEMEERLEKIKHAAGIKGSDIKDEDLMQFLDDDWSEEKWEDIMKKRFGDDYYAQKEEATEDGDGETEEGSKKHPKKPKWDDDIDISDIVPNMDAEEADENGENAVEAEGDTYGDDDVDGYADGEASSSRHKSKKDLVKEKKDKQREARKERKKIETLVDQSLNMDTRFLPGASKKNSGFFRYRETSPMSLGLDSRDILLADDKQLNQFAGLKKLAPFREEEKKKKDKKKLGKKARLRQWRKDTFGDEHGPDDAAFEAKIAAARAADEGRDEAQNRSGDVDVREGDRKKRKRSRKH